MPSFRVLPTWISRSYSKVQNPHDKWTSWRRSSSFGLAKGHFGAFENKINSNCSLLIQIGVLDQYLDCSNELALYWMLISQPDFTLIFTMHQKEEIAVPVSFIKDSFICSKQKKQGMDYSPQNYCLFVNIMVKFSDQSSVAQKRK